MKKKMFFLINGLLGGLLALAPFVLFPVCSMPAPDGGPMKCYYSGWFIVVMGVIILAISLLALLMKAKKKVASFSYLVAGVAALLCYMVPHRIIRIGHKATDGWECGLCSNVHHSCVSVTMLMVTKIVIAVVVVNVIALIYNFVSQDR